MVPINQCLEILNGNKSKQQYTRNDCELIRSLLYIFAEIEIGQLSSEFFSKNNIFSQLKAA